MATPHLYVITGVSNFVGIFSGPTAIPVNIPIGATILNAVIIANPTTNYSLGSDVTSLFSGPVFVPFAANIEISSVGVGPNGMNVLLQNAPSDTTIAGAEILILYEI